MSQSKLIRIRHVISDVDGVLRDASMLVNEATSRVLSPFGVQHTLSPNDEWKVRGLDGFDRGPYSMCAVLAIDRSGLDVRGILTQEDPIQTITGLIKQYITKREEATIADRYSLGLSFFNSPEAAQFVIQIEGVRESIILLRNNNYIITAFSNSTSTSVIRDLSRTGVMAYIDDIICREDIQNPKPAPDGIVKAMGRYLFSRQETAYVGDKSEDIIAAKAAKIVSIGVLSGQGTQNQLESASPDFIFNNFREFAENLIQSRRT